MNKHITVFLLICAGFLALLTGCTKTAGTEKEIVCTTYPVWLITRDLMTGAENPPPLSLLVPPDNGCPHDFALDTNSMIRLSRIKDLLLLRNGGLDDAIAESVRKINENMIDCYTNVHHGHHHDHHHGEPCSHDPHIFTAPGSAKLMVCGIANALQEFDPANKAIYEANKVRILEKLDALSAKAKGIGKGKKVIAMHNSFNHLMKETGFDLRGVIFDGHISALSPAELNRWITLIKEEKIVLLITEPQTPYQVADQLRKETGITLLELDPAASGKFDIPADHLWETISGNIKKLREAAE